MLINDTQPEELRVALIDGQSIDEFDIEQELESTQMGGLIDMEQPQEEVTEEEVIEEDEL